MKFERNWSKQHDKNFKAPEAEREWLTDSYKRGFLAAADVS
jgi:hypothetical protein